MGRHAVTVKLNINTELTDEEIERGDVVLSVKQPSLGTRHATPPPVTHDASRVEVISSTEN